MKPLSEFYKNRNAKDGLTFWCKSCSCESNNDWKARNKDKTREYDKTYRQENHDHIIRVNKLYRSHNYEKWMDIAKKYRAEHPEICKANARKRGRRRRSAPGWNTPEQLQAKYDYYNHRCWICGTDLDSEVLEWDHVKPVAVGGSNWISNLRPICGECNAFKHNKWYGVKGLSKLIEEVYESYWIKYGDTTELQQQLLRRKPS
jgi:5-methylcytosine-specific restriction endonuclease McrA